VKNIFIPDNNIIEFNCSEIKTIKPKPENEIIKDALNNCMHQKSFQKKWLILTL